MAPWKQDKKLPFNFGFRLIKNLIQEDIGQKKSQTATVAAVKNNLEKDVPQLDN